MGTEQKPEPAIAPEGTIVRVLCAEDAAHPMSGLFVIWAGVPPNKDDAKEPDQKIVAVGHENDPTPDRFVLSIVDKAGYLQPVLPDANPWRLVELGASPHSYKLPAVAGYRVCLVRHSSAPMARALTAFLNGGEFDVDAWGGKDAWGSQTLDRAKLVKVRELEAPEKGDANEKVFNIPEAPEPDDLYVPRGHTLYDGWTLYPGMPNGKCKPLRAKVWELQRHLAALCYPVGHQETPYNVEQHDDSTPKKDKETAVFVGGIFEERTLAALACFQEHAVLGKAFEVAKRAHAHDKHLAAQKPFRPKEANQSAAAASLRARWNYLVGKDVTAELALVGPQVGLVDFATGAVIEHWLEKGYRKPGKLLLPIDATSTESIIHLREDAAVQLVMWRKLVALFGVEYGLKSGHSFRDIKAIARGRAGVLNNSIHKTGMAIDFSMKSNTSQTDFSRASPKWPVRIEPRGFLDPKSPLTKAQHKEKALKEQADAAQKSASDLRAKTPNAPPADAAPAPVPASAEEGAKKTAAARKALSSAHKDGKLKAHEDYAKALDAERRFWSKEVERLEKESQDEKTKDFFKMRWCLYGHSKLDTSDGAMDGLLDALAGFAKAMEDALAERFHADVRDAGREWVRTKAKDYAPFLEPGRFLNAARLPGDGLRDRLRATFFRTELNPFMPDAWQEDGGDSLGKALTPDKDRGAVDPDSKITPFPPPGNDYTAKSYANLTALGHLAGMRSIGTAGKKWKLQMSTVPCLGFAKVVELVDAASGHKDAKAVPVVLVHAKGVSISRPQADLDLDFLKAWAKQVGELSLAPGEKKKRSAHLSFSGPQVTAALPPEAKKDDGHRLIDALKGDFKDKRFWVVKAGQSTQVSDWLGSAHTGAQLAEKLEAACKALWETRAKEVPKRQRDWWEVTLQPIFEKGGTPATINDVAFLPKDQVMIPAPGEPRTLEWWHYQSNHAQNGRWDDQVESIGFSKKILLAPAEPPMQDGGAFDGAGIGYTSAEMESMAGGMSVNSEPENVWTERPKGWG